jgi:MFS family permease
MVEDRDDLSNAIAINSSMANGARLVGPALAGLVIAAFGEGWNYVCTYRPIRSILLLFALISLMGWPYSVLLPIFAGPVLHGGPHTLGWLTGASGVGAWISALSLAARKSIVGLTRMISISAAIFGISRMLFGLSHSVWLSLSLMVLVGFGIMQCASASNIVIQSLVTEDMRARVMSYYTMAFFGGAPFGSLLEQRNISPGIQQRYQEQGGCPASENDRSPAQAPRLIEPVGAASRRAS